MALISFEGTGLVKQFIATRYMRRRVFAGVQIPEYVKTHIEKKMEPFRSLPVFWSSADNIHLTLVFLGYIEDDRLSEVCAAISKTVSSFDSFEIVLDRIEVAPDAEHPRTIWTSGEPSSALRDLKQAIEKSLGMFANEYKEFRPHVTLGRIRAGKWKLLETPPRIQESVRLVVPVSSITVFESLIEEGKRKYLPLEECELEGDAGAAE